MTFQEYLELGRGDICEIDRVGDKDHGRLVVVRYIDDTWIVVKSFDKEPFESSSHGETLKIMDRRSLRIFLKAVKESE